MRKKCQISTYVDIEVYKIISKLEIEYKKEGESKNSIINKCILSGLENRYKIKV